MRILLVKLDEAIGPRMKPCYSPPIGLWSLREAARQHGDECTVVDMNIGHRLPNRAFDLVGISAQFSQQHDRYTAVAAECRKRWPAARIVAGGFHAAAVEPPPEIDEVCHGAGEPFLYPDYGPTCPRPTLTDMAPYWELQAPHDLTSHGDRWMPIETSRGCPKHCRFCGVGGYWGNWQPIPGITKYLDYLRRTGIEELLIEDDNLLVRGVPEGLEEFTWSTPNGVEIRKALRHIDRLTGCWRLSLPFETGSAHTAELMRIGSKWFEADEARRAVEAFRGRGIRTCGFFIIGYPGETLADIHETLRYANSLPLDDRHIYIATPYPGTPLYEDCKAAGWLRYDGPELYRRLGYTTGLIDTPQWTAEQVTEIRLEDRRQALARRARR